MEWSYAKAALAIAMTFSRTSSGRDGHARTTVSRSAESIETGASTAPDSAPPPSFDTAFPSVFESLRVYWTLRAESDGVTLRGKTWVARFLDDSVQQGVAPSCSAPSREKALGARFGGFPRLIQEWAQLSKDRDDPGVLPFVMLGLGRLDGHVFVLPVHVVPRHDRRFGR